MKTKSINLTDLKPYSENPVKHDKRNRDVVRKSLLDFGQYRPLIVRQATMEILVGNCTYSQMLELGWDQAHCLVLDIDAKKAKSLVIVDNKSSDLHKWDDKILTDLLKGLDEDLQDLSGFDESEISSLLDEYADIEVHDDLDKIPDISQEEVTVQLGDLYLLGEHRLLCGDSTDKSLVRILMDNEKADLLHTDPPYNVDYVGKGSSAMTIENDSMSPEEFRSFLFDSMSCGADFLKPGRPFYVWHADLETINFRESCLGNNLLVKQCLIWKKNSMVLGRQDYQWIHEPCLYGWKEGAAHYWQGGRKQTTIIEHDRPTRNDIHPTMKPIGLVEICIKNSCPRGGIVLDLFGGSGSTMIAAEISGRRSRTMELDPIYCHRIIRRWEELTGQKAIKLENVNAEV